MSIKPVNKSPYPKRDARCVACFSKDRDLQPVKDIRLIKNLCPSVKFSKCTYVVCGECEQIIKSFKQFKAKTLKTQPLLKRMSKNVQTDVDTLSNLINNLEEEEEDIYPEPIQFVESDNENNNTVNENSNDNMDNWSTTDSCKSFSDLKTDTQYVDMPMIRPDNSKTSDWLQQQKVNVPKIYGSCSMTLKDLLNQPMQYHPEKVENSKSDKASTSGIEKEIELGINAEREIINEISEKSDARAENREEEEKISENSDASKGNRAESEQSENSDLGTGNEGESKKVSASGDARVGNTAEGEKISEKNEDFTGNGEKSEKVSEGSDDCTGNDAEGEKHSEISENTNARTGHAAKEDKKSENSNAYSRHTVIVDKISKNGDVLIGYTTEGEKMSKNSVACSRHKAEGKKISVTSENTNAWTGQKKCSFCSLIYYDQKSFDIHMKAHTDISNGFFCIECHQSFPIKIIYDDHCCLKHEKKKRHAITVLSDEILEGDKKIKIGQFVTTHSNIKELTNKTDCQSVKNKMLFDEPISLNLENKQPAIPEDIPESIKRQISKESAEPIKKQKMQKSTTKLLSESTERKIIDWITYLHKHGFEINKNIIVRKLELILNEENSLNTTTTAELWYEHFSKKNPDISYITKSLLPKIKRYPTKLEVQKWSESVKNCLELNNLSHILNDPTRIFTCEQIKFSLENVVKKMDDDIHSGVNVFVNISAASSMVTPVVFLHDGNTESYTFPKSWVVNYDSHSMEKHTFYDYITKIFRDWLYEKAIELPVLLFLDEYTSKVPLELFDFCENKEIILFALPSNLKYLLKPLNTFINRVRRSWTTELGLKFTKDFGDNIEKCLKDSLDEESIKSSFEKTGLFPFKPIDNYFEGQSGTLANINNGI